MSPFHTNSWPEVQKEIKDLNCKEFFFLKKKKKKDPKPLKATTSTKHLVSVLQCFSTLIEQQQNRGPQEATQKDSTIWMGIVYFHTVKKILLGDKEMFQQLKDQRT